MTKRYGGGGTILNKDYDINNPSTFKGYDLRYFV